MSLLFLTFLWSAIMIQTGETMKHVHPLVQEIARYDREADDAVLKIKTSAELQKKQKEWKALWLDMLGGMPEEKTPLHAEVTGKIQCDGYTVEKILFQSLPGVYVTGLLYLPDSAEYKEPYPALLIVHGHSDSGKLRDGYRRMAILAVKAGFGVFAFDPVSQGERIQSGKYSWENCSGEHASLGARSWLVGWNIARFFIQDAVRSIDYMETRKELDCGKLAVAGNSGGGTMSTYMQAFDERIKAACPNSYISSVREVVRERGVHDAEQFFFNQMPNHFNHAVLLAMGQPRTELLIGARHADYFPIAGVRSTFRILKQMQKNLSIETELDMYSCDGPHGWAESSRQAALAWLKYHVKGEDTPYCRKSFVDTAALRRIPGAFDYKKEELPFPEKDGWVTKNGKVCELSGFKSIYTLILEEAERLAESRKAIRKQGRAKLQEVVRRRANIRALHQIPAEPEPFQHSYKWWYLKGIEGVEVEQHAAELAILGRSLVGERAEKLLRDAWKQYQANGGKPVVLKAEGAWCIAAAHAYAAEPQLFASVKFINPPKSWMEMLENPDPAQDSFAVTVWGALQEYDWIDLVPAEKL